MLIELEIAYDSKEAVKISDMLGAFIYKHALNTSKELAKTRGTFRDYHEGYGYEPRRNILLLSIAPTASISNIAGTSSCIEPYYANVYSRETTSGKFTIMVRQLINELKANGLWNEEIKNKIIEHAGSVQYLPELDGVINKPVFKTVYESDPLAQVDIAAAWQKHIDQAISRNIYADESWRDRLGDVYMYARKEGLKGAYYCFIEKTIKGEKYTQDVNKRGERKGFGMGTQTAGAEVAVTSEENAAAPKARGFGGTSLQRAQEPVVQEEIVYNGLTKSEIEKKLVDEMGEEYVEKLKKGEVYAKGECPVNPFEKVMCDGCQ
jgi:ribonucleoside-diphosphate reductase alpha chain